MFPPGTDGRCLTTIFGTERRRVRRLPDVGCVSPMTERSPEAPEPYRGRVVTSTTPQGQPDGGFSHRRRARRGLLPRLATCVLIAAALTALTALLAPAGWFERLDGVLTDQAFPRGSPDPSVAVVGIDQMSLSAAGTAWPWPRDRLAELVTRLGDAGARVVVLDLVLAGASSTDGTLADAMSAQPTVLASAASTASVRPGRPIEVDAGLTPPALLVDAAAAVGHTQVLADPSDGVARRVPAVVETPDRRIVPSLSLAALAVSQGVEARPVLRRPSGVEVGDTVVPTDDRYRMRISWPDGLPPADSTTGTVISASTVLRGELDPGDVGGKVVFVGVTDPTLGDQIATPVTKRVADPGVMVQAAAFHTMASRQHLVGPTTEETLIWVAVLSLLAALAVQFLPMPVAAGLSVALMIASLVGPVARASSGTLLHSVYPPLAVALAIPLSGAVRYFLETRRRRQVSALFGRYVPPSVARDLVENGDLSELVQGTTVTATVLFCDIRGFTPLTADLNAPQIRSLLDAYYDELCDVVLAHGGTVLRYTGDEILVAFGAPVPTGDHAGRAIDCALEMQARSSRIEDRLRAAALPSFGYGIGIQTGEVVSTVVGSAAKQQYALIGPALTLGSRLCGRAEAGEIVVSDDSWTSDDSERPGASTEVVRVKGLDTPLTIHRLRSDSPG